MNTVSKDRKNIADIIGNADFNYSKYPYRVDLKNRHRPSLGGADRRVQMKLNGGDVWFPVPARR